MSAQPVEPEIEVGVYSVKHGSVPLVVTEHWVVSVMPMIYNDRVILSGREEYDRAWSYTAGWCYDKGGAAVLAALAWDPETEREPVGWKKVACDGRPPA